MTPTSITTAVTKAVPGLTNASFRVVGTAGYFSATREGRGLTVLAEYIHARSVEGTIALIVAELKREVAA